MQTNTKERVGEAAKEPRGAASKKAGGEPPKRANQHNADVAEQAEGFQKKTGQIKKDFRR